MKTAIGALCVLLIALAIAKMTDTKDIQEEIRRNPHFCPNATQHIPNGGTTVKVDSPATRIEKDALIALNRKLSDESPLVTTRKWSSSPNHTE